MQIYYLDNLMISTSLDTFSTPRCSLYTSEIIRKLQHTDERKGESGMYRYSKSKVHPTPTSCFLPNTTCQKHLAMFPTIFLICSSSHSLLHATIRSKFQPRNVPHSYMCLTRHQVLRMYNNSSMYIAKANIRQCSPISKIFSQRYSMRARGWQLRLS
jgi:hypothetical protein